MAFGKTKSYTPTTSGTALERFAGSMVGTLFSACYFYAVLWLPAVAALYVWVSKTAAAVLFLPYLVSAVLPSKAVPKLLSTWFFQCVLKFHDFDQVMQDFACDWMRDTCKGESNDECSRWLDISTIQDRLQWQRPYG